ncbi:hypothetical protein [Pararhizobium sp.]|uniref:hypothetical protein n=1 Tax=Pararhizobium sp. TaxID=1977563 RepID=UPI003D0FB214
MSDFTDNVTVSKFLHDAVTRDLNDRHSWHGRILRLRRSRLGERKKNLMYPNAPNFLEPIIDDNVRSLTSTENQILWSTRHVAQFIPLDARAAAQKRYAEEAFHNMLTMVLSARAKINALIDRKNQDGMGIAKLVRNHSAYEQVFGTPAAIPDFEVRDILDTIVPTNTRNIQDAKRICDILRFSVDEFKRVGKERGWNNIDQVTRVCKKKAEHNESELDAGAPLMIGVNKAHASEDIILVWEIYYIAKDGQRRVILFCPHAPEFILKHFTWRWPTRFEIKVVQHQGKAVTEVTEIKPPPRRWPHFQMRYEDRNDFYHDVRGVAELLDDHQKAATQYLNLKGIQMDFTAKPMLRTNGPVNTLQNFFWRPGDVLPNGVDFARPPEMSRMLDFSVDLERASSARRVGAPFGSLSSIDRRKEAKTATEVQQEALTSTLLSTDAIARFTEPLSDLFNEMWQMLRHEPVPLPIVTGQDVRMLSEELFSVPFKVTAAANNRNSNPDFILSQLAVLAPYFQNNPFIKVDELTKLAVDQINPALTEVIVVDADEGSTVEQRLSMIEQALGQVAQSQQAANQLLSTMVAEDAFEDANNANRGANVQDQPSPEETFRPQAVAAVS